MDEQHEWELDLRDLCNPAYNEASSCTGDFYNDNHVTTLQLGTELSALKLSINGNIQTSFAELAEIINGKYSEIVGILHQLNQNNRNNMQPPVPVETIEEITQEIAEETVDDSPLSPGCGLPKVKNIEDIMIQWHDGGLNFKPLKLWSDFKPDTYRCVKDAFSLRKTIAEKVIRYPDINSFKEVYPGFIGLKKLARQIILDGRRMV
jgi:hypothetical protein